MGMIELNLRKSEDELFKNLSKTYRYQIRKCIREYYL